VAYTCSSSYWEGWGERIRRAQEFEDYLATETDPDSNRHLLDKYAITLGKHAYLKKYLLAEAVW
jgi:hypothetical protein